MAKPKLYAPDAAHHEIAHALRAYGYGWPLIGVGVNRNSPHSATVFGGRPSRTTALQEIQVALVGMLASSRLLGTTLTTNDIRWILHHATSWHRAGFETRWKFRAPRVHFDQLTPDHLYYCQPVFNDDFAQIFHGLIKIHYHRHATIPRWGTLLRQFRYHQRIAQRWLVENWTTIDYLARYTIRYTQPRAHFPRFLSGDKMEELLIRRGHRIALQRQRQQIRDKLERWFRINGISTSVD